MNIIIVFYFSFLNCIVYPNEEIFNFDNKYLNIYNFILFLTSIICIIVGSKGLIEEKLYFIELYIFFIIIKLMITTLINIVVINSVKDIYIPILIYLYYWVLQNTILNGLLLILNLYTYVYFFLNK